MWPLITKTSQLIILAIASLGISILVSFITKVNFAQIKPKSSLAYWNEVRYHVVIEHEKEYVCSGALIHKRNVITLASRMRNILTGNTYEPTSLKVIVGTHILPGAIAYDVENVILHPGYESNMRKDDIAVILLKQEVKANYRPISYLPKKDVGKEHEVLVSGYGDLVFSRGSLHKFNMKIVEAVRCRKLIAKLSGNSLDMSKKFCAVAEHGANHPRINLGSPATVNGKYIVGLFMGHYPNYPGIFIDVTEYVTFIDQQIKSPI